MSARLRSIARSCCALLLTTALLGSCADEPAPSDAQLADAASDARVQDDASAPETSVPSDASTARDAAASLDAALDAAAEDAARPPDASALPATFVDALLNDPPSYLGTRGASADCTHSYRTIGHAPADLAAGGHPLFLYFAGTAGSAADQSARYDSMAADAVTAAMAQRGFVALAVEYDNQLLSIFTDKRPCLFGPDNARGLLAVACAIPGVDCQRGIATWGHSQGALLAHAAANFDARVRAVWTAGYSGMSGAQLAYSRFRTVNGEREPMNSAVATANATAGFGPDDACPDDGRDRCLRGDGSGWIVVRMAASAQNAGDHCWFNKRTCAANEESLEPNWLDAASSTPFALGPNADWIAATVARP